MRLLRRLLLLQKIQQIRRTVFNQKPQACNKKDPECLHERGIQDNRPKMTILRRMTML